MDSIVEMKRDIEQLKSLFARSMKGGPVRQVDAKKGYRISLGTDDEGGELLSPWLPHPETAKTSIPLKEGDVVGVFAPSGELTQGFIVRGGYSKDRSTPNENMDANVFQDAGVRISIADGELVIEAGGTTYSFSAAGLSIAGGRVEHDGKNIGATHTHGGVLRGSANTDSPNS